MNGFWTYMGRFVNKTPYEYNVFKSCSPAPTLEQVEWEKVLTLLPFDDNKAHDSAGDLVETDATGNMNILLRDPQGSGCIIKVEPVDHAKNNNAKSVYIKIGVRASGRCLYDFSFGPYEIVISPVYFNLFDAYNAEAKEQGKELKINKIRYCGYQDTVLEFEINPDGARVVPWSRSFVLDGQTVPLEVDLP